jgi:hypothetical protein
MNNYYNKYLKYKNKYLQLKNQTGGDYTDVSVNDIHFQVPSSLTDTLVTMDLFNDPVMTSDGQTYERTSIEQWFRQRRQTSPNTRTVLRDNILIPNLTFKNVINEIVNKEITSNDSNYVYIDVTHNDITFTIKLPPSFLNKNIIDYYYGGECFYDFYNDPVVASDGYTYERNYIEGWLNIFDISPTTGEQLINNKLLINYALKNAINEIIEKEFSNYNPAFTLVTKRQKKCKVHPINDFLRYKKESIIFNLLKSVPDNEKIDILRNLSPYDIVKTYIINIDYIDMDVDFPEVSHTLTIIKNFMEQNHNDIFIYAINKYNIENVEILKFYQQQELEEEKEQKEILLNESLEYNTKQRNLQKRQNLRK